MNIGTSVVNSREWNKMNIHLAFYWEDSKLLCVRNLILLFCLYCNISPLSRSKIIFAQQKLQHIVIKNGRRQADREISQCGYHFQWLHLALTFLLSWPGDLSRAWYERDHHMPRKAEPLLPMVWSPPVGANKYRFSFFSIIK